MPEGELDLRLHRLLVFSDGIYAIALTWSWAVRWRARNFTATIC